MRAHLFFALLLFASAALGQTPHAETVPLGSGPTSGGDTAIWLHPTDLSQSLVLGVDTQAAGFYAFALDGGVRQAVAIGPTRAVDVRYDVTFADAGSDLFLAVTVQGAIYFLTYDGSQFINVTETGLTAGIFPQAAALFKGRDGQLYVFVSDLAGVLKQFRVFSTDAGLLSAEIARELNLSDSILGLSADDTRGVLVLTQSSQGLYELDGDPDSGSAVSPIDLVGMGHLTSGLTGIALYPTRAGTGALVVANASTSQFVAYQRLSPHAFIGAFSLTAGESVHGTIGLEAVPTRLPNFDGGLFVVHDALNIEGPTYKLYDWAEVTSLAQGLPVDLLFDPRGPALSDAGGSDGGGGGTGGGSGGSHGGIPGGGPSTDESHPGSTCSCEVTSAIVPFALLVFLLRRRAHAR